MSVTERPPDDAGSHRTALEKRWVSWAPRTTAQLLDHVAQADPSAPYVLTDERTHTYADVASRSMRLAAGLHALGVQRGDHVAVMMANFPEAVALKFAVARLGAVSVSINFMLRQEELGYVLQQSRSRFLIVMDEFRGLDYARELDALIPGWEQRAGGGTLRQLERVFIYGTRGAPHRGRDVDDLVAAGADISDDTIRTLTNAADPASTSDLLYTSGTTGKAKGVMLTHDAVLRTAYASAYSRALSDRYRIAYAMPLYHVFGYVEATVAVLFVRGSIVPHTSFDAHEMLSAVGVHRADEIMCVPAMTCVLLDRAEEQPYDLTSLGTIFSSGAAHAPAMWQRMYDVLGVDRIFTAYGQTETTASTMCTLPGDPVERLLRTNGAAKPAGIAGDHSLGGTLAVYKTVDTATGAEVAPGEVGELLVKGPILTQGYFDKPAETAALFTDDGWMRTGDLGRIDADGYLTLTGRRKESYRFGGELVIPSDIEGVLNDHPDVAEAHVVGIPHPRWGDVGCAWVVSSSASAQDPQALLDYCRTRLARFKVPAHVLFIDAEDLPRTVTGRVQKFQLVDRAVLAINSHVDAPA